MKTKNVKKTESSTIATIDELRYSYNWLALCSQYKKFDEIVKLAEDAYLSDCCITDDERLCTICLLRGNKIFAKIFFKSAYGHDFIEDFKMQIKDLHKETNGRYVGGMKYVYFTANPTYVYRLTNHDSSHKAPAYEKLKLSEYNKLFNTEYASVNDAVEKDPEYLFFEDELDF